MPQFKEVGPIQLDQETKQAIDGIMEQMEAILPCTAIAGNIANTAYPVHVLLQLTANQLEIRLMDDSVLSRCEITGVYPIVTLYPHKDKQFFLELSPEQNYDIVVTKSVDRDLIATCIRSFCGKILSAQQADSFIKMQQLT